MDRGDPNQSLPKSHLRFAPSVAFLLATVICDSAPSQTTWTTPSPIDTTVTVFQEGPLIAVSGSGTIAIICREGLAGHLVLYTSDNQGTSFARHELDSPPTAEYELYYPDGIAFDSAGNLWVLWEWDLLVNGLAYSYHLSLSKSTDGGESFSEVLRHNRGLLIHNSRLVVDSQDNVHILRDSTSGVVYTKLTSGNPLDRFDALLPRPQGGNEEEVTFAIASDSVVHYAVGTYTIQSGRIEYSRSTDHGATFSSLVPIDTIAQQTQSAPRVVVTSPGLLLISYVIPGSPSGFTRYAVVSDNQGESFDTPFQFGAYQPSGDGYLFTDSLFVYALYASYGMVYNQYSDPRNPFVDTASFSLFAQGQLGLGNQGEKYIVMRRPLEMGEPPYLFFSSKDIPAGIEDNLTGGNNGDYWLSDNYPNPFNPSTTIIFSFPKSGEVSLSIFNLLGEEVAILASGNREAGTHTVQWDATGQPSGVYFYRLLTTDFVQTKKLVFLR